MRQLRLPLESTTMPSAIMQSGRAQPHSKTCRNIEPCGFARQRLGVRLCSAALVGWVIALNSFAAQATDGSSHAAQIAEAAEALRPKLIETRRDIHMHPELSSQEERTARMVAERLRSLGVDEIRTNVAGHGVVALLKGA